MSINRITFLSQFLKFNFFLFNSPQVAWFYFSDIIEIQLFLRNLEVGKCYVLAFELIMSEFHDEDDTPAITLSDPILVTCNSNPTLISKFILNRINLADERFDLEFHLIKEMRLNGGAPYIKVKYNEINLF